MDKTPIIEIKRCSDSWIAGLLDCGILTVDDNGLHVVEENEN